MKDAPTILDGQNAVFYILLSLSYIKSEKCVFQNFWKNEPGDLYQKCYWWNKNQKKEHFGVLHEYAPTIVSVLSMCPVQGWLSSVTQ